MSQVFTAAFALAVAAGTPEADANAGPVAVAPVRVDGDVSVGVSKRLTSELLEALEKSNVDHIALEGMECNRGDSKCHVAVAAASGARYLLVADVGVDDRDHEVSLQLIDGTTGRTVETTSGACEICGLAGASDLLREQVGQLDRALASRAGDRSVLSLRSDPSGARIFLDGTAVGTTPMELEIEAGQHEVQAELAGHLTLTRSVTTVGGVHKDVELSMQPLAQRDRARTMRAIGWSSLAVGIAVVGTGAALLAVHHRPHASSCDDADLDVNGLCPNRLDTVVGGAIATSLGAAAIVTGIVLLVRSRRATNKGTTQSALIPGVVRF